MFVCPTLELKLNDNLLIVLLRLSIHLMVADTFTLFKKGWVGGRKDSHLLMGKKKKGDEEFEMHEKKRLFSTFEVSYRKRQLL